MIQNNVTRMLAAKKIRFEAHELPAEKLGATEAAAHLGIDPGLMFKSIVISRSDGGKSILALVPGNAQVDLNALGQLVNSKKLKAASQARAEALTGFQAGGISPLTLIGKGLDVVLDESAHRREAIYISGGQRGLTLSMGAEDLVTLTKARTGPISKRS